MQQKSTWESLEKKFIKTLIKVLLLYIISIQSSVSLKKNLLLG